MMVTPVGPEIMGLVVANLPTANGGGPTSRMLWVTDRVDDVPESAGDLGPVVLVTGTHDPLEEDGLAASNRVTAAHLHWTEPSRPAGRFVPLVSDLWGVVVPGGVLAVTVPTGGPAADADADSALDRLIHDMLTATLGRLTTLDVRVWNQTGQLTMIHRRLGPDGPGPIRS